MSRLRSGFTSWLMERHPRLYFKWKGIGLHQLTVEKQFLAVNADTLRQGEGLQTLPERYNLWELTRRTAHMEGHIAELGVFRGGSARLICDAKGDTPLHLFDTFAGMPEVDSRTDGHFETGCSSDTSVEQVRSYLSAYPNVHLHPGFFPDSTQFEGAGDLRFKFVHLDVDLLSSTKAGLEWFYPRMVKGGIILAHDYNDLTVPGARIAFDDFFRGKPETVIPTWYTQALVVKA